MIAEKLSELPVDRLREIGRGITSRGQLEKLLEGLDEPERLASLWALRPYIRIRLLSRTEVSSPSSSS